MHRLAFALLFATAACSSSPKSAESTMPGNTATGAAPGGGGAAGASCGEAADHTIDLLSKAQPDAPPDVVKKIRDTLAGHCDKDQWSAESRNCFARMQTKEQGEKCEDGLSDAQKQSLMKEDPSEGSSRGPKKGGDPCDGGE
ncbi:MAG TPA: hypothetical protein VFQ65_16995 [Kofleriaceae bacterium]|nr:hypothetical protein [Kofleriaceae bacterium]